MNLSIKILIFVILPNSFTVLYKVFLETESVKHVFRNNNRASPLVKEKLICYWVLIGSVKKISCQIELNGRKCLLSHNNIE